MCTSPIFIRKKDGSIRRVPCGHCCECLAKYQNSWKARLMFERQAHDTPTFFVTLTYSADHLPFLACSAEGIYGVSFDPVYYKNPDGTQGKIRTYVKSYTVFRAADMVNLPPFFCMDKTFTPTVYAKDVQDWIKRCRIATERKRGANLRKSGFSYFFTSEYGPKHLRPHYHGLLFGLSEDEVVEWCKDWFEHFGDERYERYCTRIEVVRGDGAADYVSKYCSKGFYDHPFCSKQIAISSAVYNSRMCSYCSNGYYLDNEFNKVYSEPTEPMNYYSVPRVLDTFHLVSKRLGLEFGVRQVASVLGCSELLDGVDFSNQSDLSKLKSSLYNYFRERYSVLKDFNYYDYFNFVGLSPTLYYVPVKKVGHKDKDLASYVNLNPIVFRYVPLLTEDGAMVLDRVRTFTVQGVTKDGEPRTFTYLLPRYYQTYFLPEGCSLSARYSLRLLSLGDEKLERDFLSLKQMGKSDSEAFYVLSRREQSKMRERAIKSRKKFCKKMDELSNSSLDE